MLYKAIDAPTKTELFERQIEDLIISGQLQPGTRLPTESELAQMMKISKSSVHNGLLDLAHMGFVRITPRHGVTVENYEKNGNLDTLVALLKFHNGRFDKEMVASLLAFRGAIEGMAFEALAKNHTDDDILMLRSIIQQVREASAGRVDLNSDSVEELIFRFHLEICIRSRNKVLPMLFNAFHDASMIFWIEWVRFAGIEDTLEVMDTFVYYLSQGDGKSCAELYEKNAQDYLNFL